MRERLVAALCRLFTWIVIRAAPHPKVPLTRFFTVTADDKWDMECYLLFIRQDVMPAAGWHVVTVLMFPGEKPMVFDSAVGRCYAWHLPDRNSVSAIFRAYEADYTVRVRCRSRGHMVHSSIGPVTCVTLAKRLIGVHNAGIVTSRQLLARLWEMHDGRS